MHAYRQTLLFSATMPPEVEALARKYLRRPVVVQVGRRSGAATTVQHYVYPCPKDKKSALLVQLMRERQMDSVLVFTRTKHGADRVVRHLEREGIEADALHADKTQAQRERAEVVYQQKKSVNSRRQSLASRGSTSQEAAEDAQAAEDIALGEGPTPGATYVYVADIGNNSLLRTDLKIYRFIEPTVGATTGTISGVEMFQLRYPDGAHDAEALFVEGIHPERRGRDLTDAEVFALWDTTVAMLRQGVKDNRIVTVDRRVHPIPKGRARRGETTWVYHRDSCLRCGTPIATVELGGRPCWYCPTCQPG